MIQALCHGNTLVSREEMSISQKDSPASQREGGPVSSLWGAAGVEPRDMRPRHSAWMGRWEDEGDEAACLSLLCPDLSPVWSR